MAVTDHTCRPDHKTYRSRCGRFFHEIMSESNGDGWLPVDGRRLLVLGALLALLALAGCDGTSQQYVVCDVCGEVYGDDVGTVDVQLYENGSARWTVSVPYDGPPAAADGRASSMASEVRIYTDDDTMTPYDWRAEDVVGHARNGTVSVTFRVDDFATVRGRYLLVDGFDQHDAPHGLPYRLTAERLRVTAPEGMAIANTPRSATVTDDGRTVVWQSEDDDTLDWQTYVVAGPAGGALSKAGANLHIGTYVLGWAWPTLLADLLVSLGIAVVALGVVLRYGSDRTLRSWLDRVRATDTRQRLLAVLPALGIVTWTVVTLPPTAKRSYLLPAVYGAPAVGIGCLCLGFLVARDSRYVLPVGSTLLAVPVAAAILNATAAFDPGSGAHILAMLTPVVWLPSAAVGVAVARFVGGSDGNS